MFHPSFVSNMDRKRERRRRGIGIVGNLFDKFLTSKFLLSSPSDFLLLSLSVSLSLSLILLDFCRTVALNSYPHLVCLFRPFILFRIPAFPVSFLLRRFPNRETGQVFLFGSPFLLPPEPKIKERDFNWISSDPDERAPGFYLQGFLSFQASKAEN